MTKIKVYIVDDHEMVVTGLIGMLESNADIEVIGSSLSGEDALAVFQETAPEVVLVDINLSGMDGVALCKEILRMHPESKVIALSSFSDVSFVKQMVRNGAKGYLLKNTSGNQLIEAIKCVHSGQEYFSESIQKALLASSLGKSQRTFIPKITRREKEVLELITEELTTKEIAEKLFISTATVETHRFHLLGKLGAKNTAGLVRIAIQKGLVK